MLLQCIFLLAPIIIMAAGPSRSAVHTRVHSRKSFNYTRPRAPDSMTRDPVTKQADNVIKPLHHIEIINVQLNACKAGLGTAEVRH